VRIEFEDKSYFEISINQRGTVGIPYECEIHAKLQSKITSGEIYCWLDGLDLKAFLSELSTLNESLKGKATLNSETPGEFLFQILPANQSGHYAVVIRLSKLFFIKTQECEAVASNAFEVDAEAMSKICKKIIAYFHEELAA